MGNAESSCQSRAEQFLCDEGSGRSWTRPRLSGESKDDNSIEESNSILPPFPGSNLMESALQCGNLEAESSFDDSSVKGMLEKKSLAASCLSQAQNCVMSPTNSMELQTSDSDGDNGIRHPDSTTSDDDPTEFMDTYEEIAKGKKSSKKKASPKKQQQKKQESSTPQKKSNSSALLAKSLMKPTCLSPNSLTQREKKLLKAQEKAREHNLKYGVNALKIDSSNPSGVARPIGSPSEGVGQPSVLGSIAHALTGNADVPLGIPGGRKEGSDPSVLPPNHLSEHRAAQMEQNRTPMGRTRKHTVTIGLSLSRRSSVGHPDTVTRQTAFDFNELQDREYKYVSSTDSSGWQAGGGERGNNYAGDTFFGADSNGVTTIRNGFKSPGPGTPSQHSEKVAAPDTVHIPIITIDAESSQAVDAIVSALARGEIFIPHMAIIPEALSVNGVSPPDLVVRFGTERNEDLPPDEWPNWCLEFMHNQLYEYFHGMGARWMKRPFSITLAKKVRWKTVKHMNRYFSHAERVIDSWREKGPQYLDPQLAYIDGGATPEEVARPHGIYLLRNGVPTNYFAPNFNPPYTTKMTRSLLFNVLGKSWDKKRREWSSMPTPKLITPSMLMSAMCGCTDNHASGFVATEATLVEGPLDRSTTLPANNEIRSMTPRTPAVTPFGPLSPTTSQKKKKRDRNQQLENQINEIINTVDKKATIGYISPASTVKTKEQAPRIELNVSSSSAEFFDNQSDSMDIPSPFVVQSENKEKDIKEPQKQVKPLKDSQQSHQPREERQDKQKNERPVEDKNEENDENSGDRKNNKVRNQGFDSKKKKASATDEEWLSDIGNSPKTEYRTIASLQAEKNTVSLHAEQLRQIEVRSATLVQSSPKIGTPTVRSNNSSKSSRNALMNKNNEIGTLSMEYSQDGDSTLIGCDNKSIGTFDSTLLGQNFAPDSKSHLSSTIKESVVTKTNVKDKSKNLDEVSEDQTQRTDRSSVCTDDCSEYSSVVEEVPSDEELFAAGWAKAFDSNSGCHYYFTLDRKKTCWENPLAQTNSGDSSVGEI